MRGARGVEFFQRRGSAGFEQFGGGFLLRARVVHCIGAFRDAHDFGDTRAFRGRSALSFRHEVRARDHFRARDEFRDLRGFRDAQFHGARHPRRQRRLRLRLV